LKNENIAKVLKEYRKKNNLTVKEAAALLSQRSVFCAEKTLYGYESGHSQPDADTFLILCDIYNIDDILGAFGYVERSTIQPTKFEQRIIEYYRLHPEYQDAINKLLDLD
jgi:transcriptional regulator with XRE-family HTH domain